MKKTNLIILFLFILSPILGIGQLRQVIGQQHPMWCYAASSEMVLKFINTSFVMDQCLIINNIYGNKTCNCCKYIDCPKETNTNISNQTTICDYNCNKALPEGKYKKWVEFLKKNGYKKGTISEIKFDRIKKSIDAGFPVIGLFNISSDLVHSVVIFNYFVIENSNEVILYCHDPADQCKGCKLLIFYNKTTNRIIPKSNNTSYFLAHSLTDTEIKPIKIIYSNQ